VLYKRTLLKAITWELSGVISLSIINYLFFGSIWQSAGVAIGYGILRIFMYYLHERVWKRINWYKPKE